MVIFRRAFRLSLEVLPGSGPGRTSMGKFVCILLGFVVAIAASATGTWAEEQFAIHDVPSIESVSADKYWTADRMRRAVPCPTPKATTNSRQSPDAIFQQFAGAPGFDPSYDPGGHGGRNSEMLLDDEAGAQRAAEAIPGNPYAYPPPQTTFYVLDSLYGTSSAPFPYKAVGRVFYTAPNGKDYSCSGAVIGGRAVLTAGHCVSNGQGTYFKNWIFIPAYKAGEMPFGKWTASSFLTFAAYHQGGSMARDVAFAVVNSRDGVQISQTVGYLGFTYNLPLVQHWSMFGYPGEGPWTGAYMIDTEASYAGTDPAETPLTPGIGTTQLGGCSGGPWILYFAPGGTNKYNLANGVNSYSLDNMDYEIFSPYFDSSVKALKDQAVVK
jgi:hypothetical protein